MTEKAELEASLERTFTKGDLPFCTAPGYEIKPYDRALCALAQEPGQRCPEFRRACETAPSAPREPRSLDLPGLAFFTELLFWGAVLGLTFVLVRAVVQALAARRPAAEAEPAKARPKSGAAESPAEPRQVETDVSRLLERARRAAEAGQYEAAIGALYAALLHGLGARGVLRVDPTYTSGDYLRALSGHADLAREFRGISRSVERVQFGRSPADAGLFEELRARVLSLLKSGIAVGLLLLASTPLTGCSAPPGSFETFDESPRGYAGLRRLLTERGTSARKRVAALSEIDDGEVAKIVYLANTLEKSDEMRILSWVWEGGELVILGYDHDLAKLLSLGVRRESCGGKLARPRDAAKNQEHLFAPGRTTLQIDARASEVSTLLSCGDRPYVTQHGWGEGQITVVAEPEYFGNAALSVGDNAFFVLGLLEDPGFTVEFVGPWTGSGAETPFAAIKGAGLWPAMLHLLALGLLLLIRQGAAFGVRRDPPSVRRRAFVDHVRALGAAYRRTRATQWVLANYGAWAADKLRERTAPGEGAGLFALASAVSQRSGKSEAEVVSLLLEARQAGESNERETAGDLPALEELEKLVFPSGGKQ